SVAVVLALCYLLDWTATYYFPSVFGVYAQASYEPPRSWKKAWMEPIVDSWRVVEDLLQEEDDDKAKAEAPASSSKAPEAEASTPPWRKDESMAVEENLPPPTK
ncbi:unnamed protein product, partial [Durusdinium trenchii]